MRAIVLADCHGHPELLLNALKHAQYDMAVDRLIFAGDFLDIGVKPDECFSLLMEQGAEMLWGNHEAAILLGKSISPQDKVSWEWEGTFKKLVRGYPKWKVATTHEGVLISHAGVSQIYWRKFGLTPSVEPTAEYFNKRFELILDVREIEMDFWANDSPLWFRPGLLAPLPGVVQVVGHTPPVSIPYKDREFYITVDPFARQIENYPATRYRYAIIENGIVEVVDSHNIP